MGLLVKDINEDYLTDGMKPLTGHMPYYMTGC
jgi:hypothetical protein